jgi:hypothetical protein
MGWAVTSIETGAATLCSSSASGFGGGCVADCARAMPGIAAKENPAIADSRKRRREILRVGKFRIVIPGSLASLAPRNDNLIFSGMQPAPAA